MKLLLCIQLSIKYLFLSAIIATPTVTFADSIAIFTMNQDFSSFSAGKAKMLFKGKIKRLDHQKYSLIDWPSGSQTKVNFYRHLMGQSEAKINAVRAKLIFSGQGYPPKVMLENNFSILEALLKNNPNSISYAPISEISDEFKLLFIIPEEKNDEK